MKYIIIATVSAGTLLASLCPASAEPTLSELNSRMRMVSELQWAMLSHKVSLIQKYSDKTKPVFKELKFERTNGVFRISFEVDKACLRRYAYKQQFAGMLDSICIAEKAALEAAMPKFEKSETGWLEIYFTQLRNGQPVEIAVYNEQTKDTLVINTAPKNARRKNPSSSAIELRFQMPPIW